MGKIRTATKLLKLNNKLGLLDVGDIITLASTAYKVKNFSPTDYISDMDIDFIDREEERSDRRNTILAAAALAGGAYLLYKNRDQVVKAANQALEAGKEFANEAYDKGRELADDVEDKATDILAYGEIELTPSGDTHMHHAGGVGVEINDRFKDSKINEDARESHEAGLDEEDFKKQQEINNRK